jgi:hypothetical protein
MPATLSPDLFYLHAAAEILASERQVADIPAALAWSEQHAWIASAEGRQSFRAYPYQAAFLNDTSPKRIVLKARQVGMSNAIAIEALHKALNWPDQQILFVSRNGQLAQQLITYCQHTLARIDVPFSLEQENLTTLAFTNGSRILSLPASPATGRGFPATDVYLDEFAFAEYDQLIYESIVPALSTSGRLTLLSTPNGRGNMFFRLWAGLEGGDWSRHTVHWSQCPRYDEAWAERQRQTMTRQAFAQEYECDFVMSGEAVFDAEDLAKCAQGYVAGREGCERFVTAWDIGRRRDHTVGITIGLRGDIWHEVAYDRRLDPYPVVQSAIERRSTDFPGEHWVESNGPGDPVIENLAVRVSPFQTTARTKVQAIQALQLLIQQGRFKHRNEQLNRELGLYQWADEKLIQDSVIAAAIAAVAAEKPVREMWFVGGG